MELFKDDVDVHQVDANFLGKKTNRAPGGAFSLFM